MKGLALKPQIEDVQVAVVGAGPAGLTAAVALTREGIETLVLERRSQPSHEPRANALSTSTMELMRSWGLEAELRQGDLGVELQPWVTETMADVDAGQAADAGFPTREQSALISPTSPAAIPQDHVEPVLERHLKTLATARVERGVEVTEIEESESGVVLTVRDVADGQRRRVSARYLIGADGVRSTVRKVRGIPASWSEHLGERLSVMFRAPLWELVGEYRYAIYFLTGAGRGEVFVPVGLPDRWVFAAEWTSGRDGVEALESAQVRTWIREAADAPTLDIEIDRIATVPFGVDVAERFREGNVFLIGDAAHRVTPRGATGLNTAIRDGYDLGWKLAWVLRGWADAGLLDSYEAERRPVAEHNAVRSADETGSERPVTDELRADLGGRIAHMWLPGSARTSTLDLIGKGLTLLTGPGGGAWRGAATSLRWRVPVAARELDDLTARALGIARRGALLVRPDGMPAALWAHDDAAARSLHGAVTSLTRGGSALHSLAA